MSLLAYSSTAEANFNDFFTLLSSLENIVPYSQIVALSVKLQLFDPGKQQ